MSVSDVGSQNSLPSIARAAIAAALAFGFLAAALLDPSVLCLAPAVILALVLLTRRYPGERILTRLRGTSPRRSRRAPRERPLQRRVMIVPARGGALIAYSLAVRPPPALFSAAR
jgi:hypothetical protein